MQSQYQHYGGASAVGSGSGIDDRRRGVEVAPALKIFRIIQARARETDQL